MSSPNLNPATRKHLAVGFGTIFRAFWGRIGATWLVVLVENVLIAFVPLLIGLTIDGLLAGRSDELFYLTGILVALGAIAVGRRMYDTRVYGTVRLHLGLSLHRTSVATDVSKRSARLSMSRELVDFLEEDAPKLITGVIQIGVSLVVLSYYDPRLGIASVAVLVAMLLLYSLAHGRFYRVNARLNEQHEHQVSTLAHGSKLALFRHLRAMRKHEVAISDTEAWVYGGIFLLQVGFLVHNLQLVATLIDVTAGMIFAIATYSWEYVEAALLLPMALQSWSRLSEITARLNSDAGV